MALFDGTLTLSANLDYFENYGAYYVYHNIFGYILEMSRDLIGFLEFFRGHHRTSEEVEEAYKDDFPEEDLITFAQVFQMQSCLVDTDTIEEERALKMVPILARNTVFHQPETGAIVLYNASRDSDEVEVTTLDDWDSAFWRSVDEERTLQEIVDHLRSHPDSPGVGIEQKALAVLFQLTHSGAQFLKLSPRPIAEFNQSGRTPPYLRSTMPYTRVTESIRGESDVIVGLDSKEKVISPEALERDRFEMTFAHLFREPNPVLANRTYGAAIAHKYLAEDTLKEGHRLLEIAGRDASLASSFLLEVQRTNPDLFSSLSYTMLTDTAEQAESANAVFSQHDLSDRAAALHHPLEEFTSFSSDQTFDLILCNEAIARLETVPLRKVSLGEDEEEDEKDNEDSDKETTSKEKSGMSKDIYLGEGDSVNVIFRHNLTFHDVEGEFFFNVGAVRFVEAARKLLSDGGRLFLVEFGDLFAYPEPSDANDTADQYSIQFKTLAVVGKSLGMWHNFDWLASWLGDTNRSAQMLSTNRKHFRALRHMLASFGVDIRTIAYTRQMFEDALQGHVPFDEVHRLEFKSFNDRAMGLITSSLKVLELIEGEAPEPVSIEAPREEELPVFEPPPEENAEDENAEDENA